MLPSDILRREHVAIGRLVDAMEGMSAALRGGARVPRADIETAIEVTSKFADQLHHAKEERALFPEIRQTSVEGDALARDLQEDHHSARRVISFLVNDAHASEAKDGRARTALAHHARVLAGLLRAHMRNEEKRLFPLADALDEARAARVRSGFDAIDASIPPAVMERLEREIGALYDSYAAKGSSGAGSSAPS